MQVWRMRTGISLSVTFADRARLRALVKDRNASQKHVWRAQIVLLTAEGVGTSAIMRDTGKSKTNPRRRSLETQPFRHEVDRQHSAEGYSKAGLPEM